MPELPHPLQARGGPSAMMTLCNCFNDAALRRHVVAMPAWQMRNDHMMQLGVQLPAGWLWPQEPHCCNYRAHFA